MALLRPKNRSTTRRWTGSVPLFSQLRRDMFRNPWRYKGKKKR